MRILRAPETDDAASLSLDLSNRSSSATYGEFNHIEDSQGSFAMSLKSLAWTPSCSSFGSTVLKLVDRARATNSGCRQLAEGKGSRMLSAPEVCGDGLVDRQSEPAKTFS